MGREVGGGIGMGNTCESMADSFQCLTKRTTIKKKRKKKKKIRSTLPKVGYGEHCRLESVPRWC